ncbi:hypothetical protein D3C85_1064590 [compost metagenome]
MVPGNTVLGAKPADELKIIFPVLGAVFALGTRFDVEGKRIRLDAMPLEYLGDDLRHCLALENPLIVAELQEVQRRHQVHAVAGQAFTDIARGYPRDMTMNTFAVEAELQKSRLVEQAFQIDIRILADQIDVN